MTPRIILPCLACCLGGTLHAADPSAPRPNIVLIDADDLGFGDLGCYGETKILTPRIDQLAKEGLLFRQMYASTSLCSPSRASLLTGSYARRVGMDTGDKPADGVLYPADHKGLNPEEDTIAEILRRAGYATAAFGKWHLGDQPAFLPTKQGFDTFYGIPYSNDMGKILPNGTTDPNRKYPPLPLLRNDKVIETEPDQAMFNKNLTGEALVWMQANKDRPFFVYLPYITPHVPLIPHPDFARKSKRGAYGDLVEEFDHSVGRILDYLKENNLAENTIVIVTSDNGGKESVKANNGGLRGGKSTPFEGGHRVPCIVRWPGHIPPGSTTAALATQMDFLPTFAALAGAGFDAARIDGKDIRSLLAEPATATSPTPFYLYHLKGDLKAVRDAEGWKLFTTAEGRATELYNLQSDPSESKNVLAENPDVVSRLQAVFDSAVRDLGTGSIAGQNVRKPGHVENPVPLTLQ